MEGQKSSGGTAMILTVVGGVLAVVGSFLAWAKVSASLTQFGGGTVSQTVKGWSAGDGKITGIAAAVVIIVGLAMMAAKSSGSKRGLAIVGLLGSLTAAGVAIYDAVTIKTTSIDDFLRAAGAASVDPTVRALLEKIVHVSLGIGIYLVIAGGLIALVGSLMGLVAKSSAPAIQMGATPAAAPPMGFASPVPPPPASIPSEAPATPPMPTPAPPADPAPPSPPTDA